MKAYDVVCGFIRKNKKTFTKVGTHIAGTAGGALAVGVINRGFRKSDSRSELEKKKKENELEYELQKRLSDLRIKEAETLAKIAK